MRLIGHLADKAGAQAFSNFLCVEGISNELEPEKEGWAIWIHSEEDVIKGPFTLALVLACIGVTAYTRFGKNIELPLWITNFSLEGHRLEWMPGLPEIRHGQIWRLITPIFIHANFPHIIFNGLAMLDFGSMVESRQNAGRLALLVLVIGILSNLGQYLTVGPYFHGISGVAYGLLGYIWMKSKFHPASGYYLHPQTVMMMLVWFVICFTPIIPGIANAAHGVGLIVGVAWGYLSSFWAKRHGG